jgi:hypothetical protein
MLNEGLFQTARKEQTENALRTEYRDVGRKRLQVRNGGGLQAEELGQ